MKGHLIEYLKSGHHKVRCSHFEAIDDIVRELTVPKHFSDVIAILEYLMNWKISQIHSHEWRAEKKAGSESFVFSHHSFRELLIKAFSTRALSTQELCDIYTTVFWVAAEPIKGARLVTHDIEIYTEMDRFKCIQCGHCCLNLGDAYCTECKEEDYIRWQDEGRFDILEYVENGDLWISPVTREEVSRCPWLRKVRNKKKYICRIHDTKPRHCRDFPAYKRHAILCGCSGFGEKPKDYQYYFKKYYKIKF